MRRWWVWGLPLVGACAVPVPLGVYRLPVQTSPTTVELKTVIAHVEDQTLVLYDAGREAELARGDSQFSWDGQPQPFVFKDPKGFPLKLFVRDQVLEDAAPRPYATAPVPPLSADARSLTRVRLESDGESRTLLAVGGTLFSETAEAAPAKDATPSVLALLNSVAGTGLLLPSNAAASTEWRDAMSTSVPFDATKELPCAAPLLSLTRAKPAPGIQVPAGKFDTIWTTEIVDACKSAQPAEVTVFRVERWYAPGVGPVKIAVTMGDGKKREYRLTSTSVATSSPLLWPTPADGSWTYELHGTDGALVPGDHTVRVAEVKEIAEP